MRILWMVPVSMTLSDLQPGFQGHDIIQRQLTRKRIYTYNGRSIESRIEWFHFKWPWTTSNQWLKWTGCERKGTQLLAAPLVIEIQRSHTSNFIKNICWGPKLMYSSHTSDFPLQPLLLTKISRSRHSLTLNISETVRDTDKVIVLMGTCTRPTQLCLLPLQGRLKKLKEHLQSTT